MNKNISNLVFEGGGISGIAHLGTLDYLYANDRMKDLIRTAGSSSGAIAACITSFNLPYSDIKRTADSLEYSKAADKGSMEAESALGDINCLYRLITRFGWYSSEYFYRWMQKVISDQFNDKKKPPYTFTDFQNPLLHKDNRSFCELYIIGTNLTAGASMVFSRETTPMMEVAQAVRISISIPLFFEAVAVTQPEITGNNLVNLFCDGGVMNNYPLRLFDSQKFGSNLVRGANMDTLGIRFKSSSRPAAINNLLDYIYALMLTSGRIQQEAHYGSPMDRIRSINIDSLNISPIDFNVSPNDDTYQLLYQQGYAAAKEYFSK